MINLLALILIAASPSTGLNEFKAELKTIAARYNSENIYLKMQTTAIDGTDTTKNIITIRRYGADFYVEDESSIAIYRGKERLEINHALKKMAYSPSADSETGFEGFEDLMLQADTLRIDSFSVSPITTTLAKYYFANGNITYEFTYDKAKKEIRKYTISVYTSPLRHKCNQKFEIQYIAQQWDKVLATTDFPIEKYIKRFNKSVMTTESYKSYTLVKE